LGLTGEWDDLVKEGLKDEWAVEKKKWFVEDPSDPYQSRQPGLLKEEWSTTRGGFVA